jgi:hypothetical protein
MGCLSRSITRLCNCNNSTRFASSRCHRGSTFGVQVGSEYNMKNLTLLTLNPRCSNTQFLSTERWKSYRHKGQTSVNETEIRLVEGDFMQLATLPCVFMIRYSTSAYLKHSETKVCRALYRTLYVCALS